MNAFSGRRNLFIKNDKLYKEFKYYNKFNIMQFTDFGLIQLLWTEKKQSISFHEDTHENVRCQELPNYPEVKFVKAIIENLRGQNFEFRSFQRETNIHYRCGKI